MKKLFVSVLFIFITTMTFAKPLDRTMLNAFWQKGLLIIDETEEETTYYPKSAIELMYFDLKGEYRSLRFYSVDYNRVFRLEDYDFSLDSNSNIIIRKKTIETEQ